MGGGSVAHLGVRQAWVESLPLNLLNVCFNLFYKSENQRNETYFMNLLWDWHELMCVECLINSSNSQNYFSSLLWQQHILGYSIRTFLRSLKSFPLSLLPHTSLVNHLDHVTHHPSPRLQPCHIFVPGSILYTEPRVIIIKCHPGFIAWLFFFF